MSNLRSYAPKLLTSLRLAILLIVVLRTSAAQTSQNSRSVGNTTYSDAMLGFRYTAPSGMRDKTERFRLQIQQQAKASGTIQTLSALLAMSSGPDSAAPNWRSVTIEAYPRKAVSEPDDAKAEAQMSAWVAHSKDVSTLPRSVILSGRRFSISVFGVQEGATKKGAVVWTTIRKDKLLSFAFVANSPEQLKKLTESMKSVQFF